MNEFRACEIGSLKLRVNIFSLPKRLMMRSRCQDSGLSQYQTARVPRVNNAIAGIIRRGISSGKPDDGRTDDPDGHIDLDRARRTFLLASVIERLPSPVPAMRHHLTFAS